MEGDVGALHCRIKDRHTAPDYDRPAPKAGDRVRSRWRTEQEGDDEQPPTWSWFFATVKKGAPEGATSADIILSYDDDADNDAEESWPNEDLVVARGVGWRRGARRGASEATRFDA